jgi:hypothetical protein
MVVEELSITMEIYTKVNFLKGNDQDLEFIFLIKSINTKDNGWIIASVVMESYLEIINYFLKANFKMGLSMALASINIKMGIILKATISKTRREDTGVITFLKEEFWNHSLTLCLLKYQK